MSDQRGGCLITGGMSGQEGVLSGDGVSGQGMVSHTPPLTRHTNT